MALVQQIPATRFIAYVYLCSNLFYTENRELKLEIAAELEFMGKQKRENGMSLKLCHL